MIRRCWQKWLEACFLFTQDQSKWNGLILDTLNGVSLKETNAKINVNELNFFNIG